MNKIFIGIVVFILLAVNIWQWWPDKTDSNSIPIRNTENISALTLPLPDYSRNSGLEVLTDPFYGDQVREDKKPQKAPLSTKIVPGKLPEDPFKGYELAGILYKNGRMSAFMIISGTSRIVVKGDVINGSVLVERITESAVTLRHTRNNKKRTIKLQ